MKSKTNKILLWTYSQCRAQDEALNMAATMQLAITAAIVTATRTARTVVHMNHLRAVLSVQQRFVHVKYPLSVQENEWHHPKHCQLDDLEVRPHTVDAAVYYVVHVVLRRRHRPLFCEKNICRWNRARKRHDAWKSLGWGGMICTHSHTFLYTKIEISFQPKIFETFPIKKNNNKLGDTRTVCGCLNEKL